MVAEPPEVREERAAVEVTDTPLAGFPLCCSLYLVGGGSHLRLSDPNPNPNLNPNPNSNSNPNPNPNPNLRYSDPNPERKAKLRGLDRITNLLKASAEFAKLAEDSAEGEPLVAAHVSLASPPAEALN